MGTGATGHDHSWVFQAKLYWRLKVLGEDQEERGAGLGAGDWLVTVDEGLVDEAARQVGGEQDLHVGLADAALGQVAAGIVRRHVHIHLDAGERDAGAGSGRIAHHHLDVIGAGEALVVVVVHDQSVACGG